MKKILVGILTTVLVFSSTISMTFAAPPQGKGNSSKGTEKKEVQQTIKVEKKEVQQNIKTERKTIKDEIKKAKDGYKQVKHTQIKPLLEEVRKSKQTINTLVSQLKEAIEKGTIQLSKEELDLIKQQIISIRKNRTDFKPFSNPIAKINSIKDSKQLSEVLKEIPEIQLAKIDTINKQLEEMNKLIEMLKVLVGNTTTSTDGTTPTVPPTDSTTPTVPPVENTTPTENQTNTTETPVTETGNI